MKIPVSIVMPVYNGKAHLEDSINSLLKQTYRDFELITVDDASSDGSLSILERYVKQDSRFKLVTNHKNIGLTRSLIKAIDMAQGQYLARQDADDISLPQRIEKQVDFLEDNTSYAAVGTSANIIDEDGKILKKAWVPKSWASIQQVLKFGNCFLHGSMMMRREDYFNAGGYRAAFSVGQDYDLWLRLSETGKLRNLEESLYSWRKTASSVSSMKTDSQFKVGALALYDFRYKKRIKLDEGFEINTFLENLTADDREKYDSCLRNLCLRHGNIEMANKYLNTGIVNPALIALTRLLFTLRSLRK